VDEGAVRVSAGGKEAAPPPTSENVEALQREIETIRNGLDGMVGELDRRRHTLFDVRTQLHRHTVPLIAVAAALLGITAGGIALGVAHRRRRARLGARLDRFQQALRRMIDKPARVANKPTMGQKIVGAGGAAAASMIVKRLAGNLLHDRAARGPREHAERP
jgi:hypothetical protein